MAFSFFDPGTLPFDLNVCVMMSLNLSEKLWKRFVASLLPMSLQAFWVPYHPSFVSMTYEMQAVDTSVLRRLTQRIFMLWQPRAQRKGTLVANNLAWHLMTGAPILTRRTFGQVSTALFVPQTWLWGLTQLDLRETHQTCGWQSLTCSTRGWSCCPLVLPTLSVCLSQVSLFFPTWNSYTAYYMAKN